MRTTGDVMNELITARTAILKADQYPRCDIRSTTEKVDELLGRTGICAHGVGTGLVDADCKTGWPEHFPIRPVMFMAHNWGNDRMLRTRPRNGEEGVGGRL